MGAGKSKVVEHFSGGSVTNTSEQESNAFLSQQYVGSCDIKCNNQISGVDVKIIGSEIKGDVGLKQACSANGQCMFNTVQVALTDMFLKAGQSATAAGGLDPNLIKNKDVLNESYMKMNQSILQSISQKCNIESFNQINDSTLYVENSKIGGDLVVDQKGNVQGGCALQSAMNATAKAMGATEQCGTEGTKGKKACSGKSTNIGTIIGYVVGGIVAFLILLIIITLIRRYYARKGDSRKIESSGRKDGGRRNGRGERPIITTLD